MKHLIFLLLTIIYLQPFWVQAQNSNSFFQKYHTHRTPLKNSFLKFTTEKNGHVAFLGGSFTYESGWRDSVCSYLTEKFPETEFDFVNAGMPSPGFVQGAFRFEDDVLTNGQVDLLFIELKVNNEINKKPSVEIIRETEGIIRHALISNPNCDIVFIYSGNAKHYENEEIPTEIQNTDTILEHYKIPAINLVKEIDEQILTGEIKIADETNKYLLSNSEQKIFTQSLKTFLRNEWNVTAFSEKLSSKELPSLIDEFSFFNGKQIEPNQKKPIKGWKLLDNKNERVLEGTYPGKIIKFHFKGNAVGIAILTSLDAGIIEYSVDNQPWKKQDLFSQKDNLNKELKYFILESGLKNRRHTLQLRIADEKNPESSGYKCHIRYFFFNGN